MRYATIKKDLAKLIYQELQPIQERRRELVKKKDYLADVIATGNQQASMVARATMAEVKEKFALSTVV